MQQKQTKDYTLMKKVLSISVNGEFKQYLMISESRFITKMIENWGSVTVTICELTKERYKIEFGK